MTRWVAVLVLGTVLGGGGLPTRGWAEEKVITSHKAKDIVITLKSDSGQWKKGKNTFTVEVASAKENKPADAGKVALTTSMTMSGMSPMIAGATLNPDGVGRYRGTIEFEDTGTRQVTVTWDGPAGKGSAKFSVPVR